MGRAVAPIGRRDARVVVVDVSSGRVEEVVGVVGDVPWLWLEEYRRPSRKVDGEEPARPHPTAHASLASAAARRHRHAPFVVR